MNRTDRSDPPVNETFKTFVTPYVAPFERFGQNDGREVGGKVANIGEMIRAEIPVPDGFAIKVSAWDRFIEYNNLMPRILELHEGLDFRNEGERHERSNHLMALIKGASMPPDVAQDIRQAYRLLSGSTDVRVAVRSSATAEDLAKASSAGEYDSKLNVYGEVDVVVAVQAVFASVFTARAMLYRDQNGIPFTGVKMAVAVMRMVQSVRSAIVFTADRISGNRNVMSMTIGMGLGETLVQSTVTADFIKVDRARRTIISRIIGSQTHQMVWSDDLRKNIDVEIEPELRDAPKADEVQTLDLADICEMVERHYGRPRDIEAAMAPNGRWYIVQSRDCTTPLIEDEPEPAVALRPFVTGIEASAGIASGPVRIIRTLQDLHAFSEGDILVTEMTTPDMLDEMELAAAVVAEIGTSNSHAAIVCGEMETPCVVGADGVMSLLRDGDIITVDGSHGKVYRGEIPELLAWHDRREARLTKLAEEGEKVKTRTKIGLIAATPRAAVKLARRNVDMVCLYRTELAVSRLKLHPRVFDAQGRREVFIRSLVDSMSAYCEAFFPRYLADNSKGLVVVRTLDYKDDEMARLEGSELYEKPGKNFMLGKRGLFRYEWDHVTHEMETEALKRVAQKYPNLVVMVPFPRTPEELGRVTAKLVERGLNVPLWAMAEVPLTIMYLEEFVDACQGRLKGLSIGSNDALQGLMMVDREDPILAAHAEYSENHPLMRRTFVDIVRRGKARGLTVSLCGNAVSKFPEIAADLVEAGIDSIGVDPRKADIVRNIVKETEERLGITLEA
ncbi:MAG TPA: PEP/pyruvate-binding domain-containing protein [Patescibacteria group bacterium]|nr:PEP/pyruvate-binding domain-containing protein [Patescibacteria group bacterium]